MVQVALILRGNFLEAACLLMRVMAVPCIYKSSVL